MQESGVEFAVESRDGSSVEGSGEDYEVAFGFKFWEEFFCGGF